MSADDRTYASEDALAALAKADSVDELSRGYGEFGAFVGALFGEDRNGDRFATRSLIRNVGSFIESAKTPGHAVGPLSLAACSRNIFGTSDRLADFVWDLPQSSYQFSGLPVLNATKWIDAIFRDERRPARVNELLVSLIEGSETLADANADYRFSIKPFTAKFTLPRSSPQSKRQMRQIALFGALPEDLEKLLHSRFMRKLISMNSNAPDEILIEAHRLGVPRSVAVALWNQRTPTELVDRLFEYRQINIQAAVIEHDRVGTELLMDLVTNGTRRGIFRNDEDQRVFTEHVLSDDPIPEFGEDWSQLRLPRVDTELQLRAARRLVERGVRVKLQPRQMTTSDLHLRVGLCDVATPGRRPQTLMRGPLETVFYGIEAGYPYARGSRTWSELAEVANRLPFPVPARVLRYEEVPFGWTIGRNLRAHFVRDGLDLLRNADLMDNCTAGYRIECADGNKFILAIHDEDGVPFFNVLIFPTSGGFGVDDHIYGWDNRVIDPPWLVGELSRATRAVRDGDSGMMRLGTEVARDRARLETRLGPSGKQPTKSGLEFGTEIIIEC